MEPTGRRREREAEFAEMLKKSGGGGGSRTRVRKHVVEELYMRVRFWFLVSSVRKRPKTAEYQTRYVSPLNAEPPFRSQPV